MRTRSRSLFTDYLPGNSGNNNQNSPTQKEPSKFSPTSPLLQSFRTTQSLVEEDVGSPNRKLTISLREQPSSANSSPSTAGTSGTFTPHSPTTPSPSMTTPRRRKLSLGVSSMQNTPPSNSSFPAAFNQAASSPTSTLNNNNNQSGSSSPTNSTSPSSLSSSPSNSLFINDAGGSSSPRNYSPRRYSIMPSVGFATPPNSNSNGNSRRNSLERKVSENFSFPNINEKPMNNRLREIKSMELDEQMDFSHNSNPDQTVTNPNDDLGLLNYIPPHFLQPAIPPQPVQERRKSLLKRNSSTSLVGDHEVPSLIPTFQRKDSVTGESFKELQRTPSNRSSAVTTPLEKTSNNSEEKSPTIMSASQFKISSADDARSGLSPKIVTTPSTPPSSSLTFANNSVKPLPPEDTSLLKSLLSMELSSEMLTTEPSERKKQYEKNEDNHDHSSFNRLVSNFSSIQKHKKDMKKIPDFEEHMKEFSSLVRQFQIKGVVLNQQEIEEFLRDDRKGGDEVDPNVLSKIRSKELESYVKTLGPKTIQMMCEWRDRFHSVHANSNAVLDFSDKKKKVEENMKLMKKAMESVATPVTTTYGRRDSLPQISASPSGSPQTSGLSMANSATPIAQTRGIVQSKSSITLSPNTPSNNSPTPKARQRSKSLISIKKFD